MPTARPRYQVTDTGRVRALLDLAATAWPELAGDRKELLLRLAETGAQRLPAAHAGLDDQLRRHTGDWVAVRDGQILTASPDPGAVVRWLREHHERAEQLFRVPANDAEIVGEHGQA